MQYKCEQCGNSIDIAGNGVFVVCDSCYKEQIVLKNIEAKTTFSPEIQPLLKRIFIFVEDGEWAKADEYCEKVLDLEPECGEAYLGKLMSEFKAKKRSDLINSSLCISENNNYKKIMRFGDADLVAEMKSVAEEIENRKEQERIFAEQVRAEQERKKLEKQQQQKEKTKESVVKVKTVTKKVLKIAVPCIVITAVLAAVGFFVYDKKIVPYNTYKDAVRWMQSGKYDMAINMFESLGDYKDSADLTLECYYSKAESLVKDGENTEAAMTYGRLGDYKDAREKSMALWNEIAVRETIATDFNHTVGLKKDGTLITAGNNYSDICSVEGWTDIIAVSASKNITMGLKSDGTVVGTGLLFSDHVFSSETDIVAISAGRNYAAALRADGTVVTPDYVDCGEDGLTDNGESTWTDIIAIVVGDNFTVGLKADGTVVATSNCYTGYSYDVSSWRDIIAISVDDNHIVGLKKDGTVVAAGENKNGQCDVDDWKGIVAIATGKYHTVGLKADGTVVATGFKEDPEKSYVRYSYQCDVETWTDIVAIAAGYEQTIGLKADGTIVAVGDNKVRVDEGVYAYKLDIKGWKNIKLP